MDAHEDYYTRNWVCSSEMECLQMWQSAAFVIDFNLALLIAWLENLVPLLNPTTIPHHSTKGAKGSIILQNE
jgi:hypothetical protein